MQIRFLLAAYFHNALKSKKTYSYLLYLFYSNDNSIRTEGEVLHELILMFKMNMAGKPKGHLMENAASTEKEKGTVLEQVTNALATPVAGFATFLYATWQLVVEQQLFLRTFLVERMGKRG